MESNIRENIYHNYVLTNAQKFISLSLSPYLHSKIEVSHHWSWLPYLGAVVAVRVTVGDC